MKLLIGEKDIPRYVNAVKILCSTKSNRDKYKEFLANIISSRNMITCDRKSNIGYDFDVNLDVFYDDDRYDPGEIKHIMMDAFNSVVRRYGYGYCEDSTRVFTIKKIDHWRSRIMQSCDFAIVNNYTDKAGTVLQQYIRFNKKQRSYVWADQTKGYYTKPKEDWLKSTGIGMKSLIAIYTKRTITRAW